MKKVLGVIGLLIVVLGVVVASDRPLPPADVRVINRQDFNTLDPQRMSYNHDLRLSYAIYETLVRWDNHSEDFGIVPGLARSWEISEDRTTYTFHLDPKAKWSDGEAVTAADVIFAWRRAILPDSAADYSGQFMHVKGARALFAHRKDQLGAYASMPSGEKSSDAARALYADTIAFSDEHLGMRALDDHTLEITLERPTAYFLDLCAFGPFNPVPRHNIERFTSFAVESGQVRVDPNAFKPPNIVSNGPYVPTAWRFKREMLIERNAFFRDPTLAKADRILIRPVNNPNTSVLAFETGAADWNSDVTVDYVADMLDAKKRGTYDNIHAYSTFGTYFWSFNCTDRLPGGRPNPFHDARVRRAFTLAVDKLDIVENVKRSGEKVARVLVPPGSIPGFTSPAGLPFDPVRARAEFEAAGWKDRDGDGQVENERGEPFPVVELLYSTGAYHDDVALAMGRMWETALGVKVELDGKELKIYKDQLKKQGYMIARGGWFGDYGDPTTFHELHRTGDGNNDRGYSDPYFDDLLTQAENEVDPAARMRILEEAERYTMEETLPVLPVWHYNYYYLFKPPVDKDGNPNPGGMRGISDHPRLIQYFWQFEVVGDAELSGGTS